MLLSCFVLFFYLIFRNNFFGYFCKFVKKKFLKKKREEDVYLLNELKDFYVIL